MKIITATENMYYSSVLSTVSSQLHFAPASILILTKVYGEEIKILK